MVISTEGAWQQMPAELLADGIAAELKRALGLPEPDWYRMIVEKRATFACTVGIERPDQRTGLEHCYLAGDYTRSDYPATIEGAVRSGLKCAALVSETFSN